MWRIPPQQLHCIEVSTPLEVTSWRARRAVLQCVAMSRSADLEIMAQGTYGVVTRQMLIRAGMSRHVVRAHVWAGRLRPLGIHTLQVPGVRWSKERSPIVAGVLEAGERAWADGAAALLLAGLTGWSTDRIDLGVSAASTPAGGIHRAQARDRAPRGQATPSRPGRRILPVPGCTGLVWVRHRLAVPPDVVATPVRRARPACAALRAAAWATSDRQAATLLAMTAQQRLARVSDMQVALERFPRLRRRRLVTDVLRDIAGGAQALGELDFARECRRRRIPKPDRQVVRRTGSGRYVLDAFWDAARLVVEIDGTHHLLGDNPTRDALRQNDLALEGLTTIRIPSLSVRADPDPFFAQITRHLQAAGVM